MCIIFLFILLLIIIGIKTGIIFPSPLKSYQFFLVDCEYKVSIQTHFCPEMSTLISKLSNLKLKHHSGKLLSKKSSFIPCLSMVNFEIKHILVIKVCLFSFRLFLRRGELDNPHKPKTWKTYKENFAVDITFTKL